jgi:hypothetical protein
MHGPKPATKPPAKHPGRRKGGRQQPRKSQQEVQEPRRTLAGKTKRGVKIHATEIQLWAHRKVQTFAVVNTGMHMADTIDRAVRELECRAGQQEKDKASPI